MRFNQFSYQPTTSSQRFAELEGLGLKLSPQLSLKRQFEDFICWSFSLILTRIMPYRLWLRIKKQI